MKLSARLYLAFWLATALLVAIAVATIFFAQHLHDVLDRLRYDDFQRAQLAEAEAAISANPADIPAHLARLHDLENLARSGSERRLLREAQAELARRRGLAGVTGKLGQLATFYRDATAVAHAHLVLLHRRAVLCTVVALVDAAVLLAALILLVRYWLLRPIQQIGEAADKIAAGDLQQPLVATGQDELDRLARSFNSLSATLRALNDRLQKTERLAGIGEACAFVAHNLRGPLGAIQALADYERAAANVSPDARAALDHIIVTAATLERWVRNLIDSVRPFELKLARQPIEPILHDALSLLQRRCAEKKLDVAMQAADDLVDAQFDGALVEQALVSLLTNAVEASPDNGKITVTATRDNGALIIAIADEGPGMSAAMLEKAFDPFFTTKPDGAGLGLTIARKIIELHGGALAIDSKTGRGTCVRVSLPPFVKNNHAG